MTVWSPLDRELVVRRDAGGRVRAEIADGERPVEGGDPVVLRVGHWLDSTRGHGSACRTCVREAVIDVLPRVCPRLRGLAEGRRSQLRLHVVDQTVRVSRCGRTFTIVSGGVDATAFTHEDAAYWASWFIAWELCESSAGGPDAWFDICSGCRPEEVERRHGRRRDVARRRRLVAPVATRPPALTIPSGPRTGGPPNRCATPYGWR